MKKRTISGLAMAAPLLAFPAVAAAPALASGSGQTTLTANLQPVPDNMVNGSGTATVTVNGNTVSVSIHATGLDHTSPNGLPAHAQHIHIGGTHTCPTSSLAQMHNGHLAIGVKDAAPAYGGIMASLTTTGDTSPNSALALKRFPTTPNGTESYNRTFTVNSNVAQQIAGGQGVIVIHGIDYLHNGNYKDLGKSEIDPSLPFEGTAPALCGQLVAAPVGAAATGGGSTSGVQDEALFALGGAALLAAAGTLAYRRRTSAR